MAERIKAKLEIETVEFPKTTETALLSTVTLCKYVNSALRATFKDYTGCVIEPVFNDQYSQRHQVRCKLIFTLGADNGSGAKIAAFVPVAEGVKAKVTNGRANYLDAVESHNARLRSLNSAVITQDAIDIIHPLLWSELQSELKETAEAYASRGVISEDCTNLPYNTQSVINPVISYIDVGAVLKALWTPKEESKDDEYLVTAVKNLTPITPQYPGYPGMQQNVTQKYLFSVSKLNRNDVMDLANEVGFIDRTSTINCFTESF